MIATARSVSRRPDLRGKLAPSPRRAVSRRPDLRGRLRDLEARASVGRSQPNDEIAALDKAVEQLRTDVGAYTPPAEDVGRVTAWASIVQALNLFALEWGRFKTALADDLWWGDDDETILSTLRNEYNALRQRVLTETQARVTAPEAETPKEIDPNYKPPPAPSTDLTVKELALYLAIVGVVGLVGYAALRAKLSPLLRELSRGGVSYAKAA